MVEGSELLDGEISRCDRPCESLKGFTSEKYKEKRRKRDAEIELAVGKSWEMHENSEKYKKQWKLTNLLLLTQSFSIMVIITLIVVVGVLWG